MKLEDVNCNKKRLWRILHDLVSFSILLPPENEGIIIQYSQIQRTEMSLKFTESDSFSGLKIWLGDFLLSKWNVENYQ